MVVAILYLLHLLGAVVWVGGMAFAILALRPAAHEALAGPKTLILYPEGWHLLFRDLQAARVWRDVGDWMEARS